MDENSRFITFLIWSQIILSWLFKGLLWPVQRYTKPMLALALASAIVLYCYGTFAGGLHSRSSGIVLIVLVVWFAATVASIWPQPHFHEFEHVDHKVQTDPNDWLAGL